MNSNTALHKVADSRSIKDANKQYETAELLIRSGVNVNAQNVNHQTAIDLASNSRSNFSIVTVDYAYFFQKKTNYNFLVISSQLKNY